MRITIQNIDQRVRELQTRLDELNKIIDEKIHLFEEELKKRNNDNFRFTEEEFDNARQPELSEAIKIGRQMRLIKNYVLRESIDPDKHHVMTLKEFIKNVRYGGFIDYDGFGKYAKDGMISNVHIYPSDVKTKMIRGDFDTIVWYNR